MVKRFIAVLGLLITALVPAMADIAGIPAGRYVTNRSTGAGEQFNVSHSTASSFAVSDLTSGQCVQAGTGGRLTVTGSACGSGGGGGGDNLGSHISTKTVTANFGITGSTLSFVSATLGSFSVTGTTSTIGTSNIDTKNSSVYFGVNAGQSNSASSNVGIGFYAASGSGGTNNVAIGEQALGGVSTGAGVSENIAIGRNTLSNLSSPPLGQNVIVGDYAGEDMTTGNEQVAIGYKALQKTTAGFENIAVGIHALKNNVEGFANTAVGAFALENSTQNVHIANTAIGHSAGGGGDIAIFNPQNEAGNSQYSTFVGAYTGRTSSTTLMQYGIAIGYRAEARGSNTATIGGEPGSVHQVELFVSSASIMSLASGQCVQTTTGGRLTTTGAPCGSGGGSGTSPLSGFYLRDGSSVIWHVTVSTSGALQTATVGSAPSGSLYRTSIVMQDASFGFWTLTVNTSGVLVTTSGGTTAQTIQDILVNDSSGLTWVVTVTIAGALVTS